MIICYVDHNDSDHRVSTGNNDNNYGNDEFHYFKNVVLIMILTMLTLPAPPPPPPPHTHKAGSWTYRGLEVVDLPPMYANSVMIVISSQGSGNQQRQSLAQEQINRVSRQLGWRPYVIVPQVQT